LKSTRTLTRLGASLVIAASWIGAAHAAGGADMPIQVVHVADLKLSSPQDMAELLRRISTAAQEVCPNPRSESGIKANQARYCLKDAVQSAVRRVNSPVLTALFLRGHTDSTSTMLALRTP
jgi:UrcA family protein